MNKKFKSTFSYALTGLGIILLIMTNACSTAKETTGIDLKNLDTTVVPGNDFYKYACGGWMTNHPLTG